MINEWMNDFLNPVPYPKKIYITPTYFSVLKLQNYSSECSSCVFLRKNWRKIVTNSIMNLKHTLYVITDAKALCSILYSSGNIQIKCCWKPVDPPQLHHSHKKRKDSLETRAKRAVLRGYVENYPILKPILLYRASKYTQTKRLG